MTSSYCWILGHRSWNNMLTIVFYYNPWTNKGFVLTKIPQPWPNVIVKTFRCLININRTLLYSSFECLSRNCLYLISRRCSISEVIIQFSLQVQVHHMLYYILLLVFISCLKLLKHNIHHITSLCKMQYVEIVNDTWTSYFSMFCVKG